MINPSVRKATPGRGLEHLKVTLQHVLKRWPAVLQRRHYLQAISQDEDLRKALIHTYAAHVHNTLHAALSVDLLRDIGALILDRDPKSASLAQAVAALKTDAIRQSLRDTYAADHKSHLDHRLPSVLSRIELNLLSTPCAHTIRTIRNKAVAHYDVDHDGKNWKMWDLTEVGLTYGQLDQYIDGCTEAVDGLCGLVLRQVFSFDALPKVSETYVQEYIAALVIGLKSQKEANEARRAENLSQLHVLSQSDVSDDSPNS
jgi:hypothetical protein